MFTPEEIASRQFLIALRGYDREEVDAFVREVADEQQRLLDRLQRLEERLSATGDAAAAPDHAADHTVDHREAFRRLGEETTRILVAAEEAAAGIEQRAQEDARATVTAARESAQREIDEARSQGEQIVARAREERERTLEAVRELEATQQRLAADLDEAVRAVGSVAARLHPDVGTELAEVAAEAAAAEPQGPSEPATRPEAAPTAATAEPEQETVEPDTGIHLPGEVAPADAARSVSDVVSHSLREEALAGIRPGMVRRLKRTLRDVQNGVLDTLRRAAGGGEVDTPSGDDLDALAGVGEPFLVEAYRAGLSDGARLADVAPLEGDIDAAPARAAAEALGEELAHEIAASLEPTLRAGLDAGEDISSLSDRVGEVFRDLKGPVAEAAVDEHLTRTYGLGVHDGWAAAGVTDRVWVLGDEPRCPENRCRSNASEGPVAIDREFPSGHLVPPAHPGCTCTVAPAQG